MELFYLEFWQIILVYVIRLFLPLILLNKIIISFKL
jgi:hypothetical protein